MNEKKFIPGECFEFQENSTELTPSDRLQELYNSLTPEDKVLFPSSKRLSIDGLATTLWLQPEKIILPNGKEITSIIWKPEHLSRVFDFISKSSVKALLGKNDVVTIDGVCPTRLLPTISHSLHPVSTSVSYPQGWLDVKLPLSGVEVAGEGIAEGVKFTITEDEEKTSVSFELTDPSIDVIKAMQTLVAPEVAKGKPVFVSWRWPIAIATALSEAYAHRVPFVACFQPWTGRVVCISHSDVQLGTIFQ